MPKRKSVKNASTSSDPTTADVQIATLTALIERAEQLLDRLHAVDVVETPAPYAPRTSRPSVH